MSKSQITRVELEQALDRLLSGKTERIAPNRKVSVKAVEEEAGLGDGSAYYYKDIVQKIKKAVLFLTHRKSKLKMCMKIKSLA